MTTKLETLDAALRNALRQDPELRVRTLVSGAIEVVTYKPPTESVRAFAQSLGAALCAENDAQPPSKDKVESFIKSMKLKATVTNGSLPSGRVLVVVTGDIITFAERARIVTAFGPGVLIDSALRI